jgi:ABC-2 type transport system ATP-binding protein
VAELMKLVRPQMSINIGVAGNKEDAARLLQGHSLVDRVTSGDEWLTVTLVNGHEDYSDLATMLVSAGHKLTLMREEELNLETAFMALTKGLTS